MAITAKFQADFSSFSDAVDKAQVELRSFETGAGKVESSLTRMANSLSGTSIIQQATVMTEAIARVGGVSALTEKELAKVGATAQEAAAKLTALGQTVPAGLQQIADAAKKTNDSFGQFGDLLTRITERLTIYEALREGFSFAKEAIESTAKLEEMALATGITVDGLQRLGFVTREFGIESEVMTRGIEQISAKLAGGDKNATTAVELLGLSVKDLLAAGPQEAFLQIAEAAGRIDDPMTKGAIAADLFGGRLAKQLIPALSDLRTKMADVPQDAIISQANITAAHDFEVGLDHVETRLKSWTVSILGGLSAYNKWLESGTGVTGFLDLLHGKTLTATTDVGQHAASVEGAAKSTIHLTETVKDRIAADALAAEELKKFTAAMVEIDSAGIGWRGTLDTINGSVAEAVKFYLEAGVAQDKLAKAYGLTASQVKAVETSLKDEQEAWKIEQKSILETTKLWDDFFALRTQHGGTATDTQIAQIHKWADDLTATMQKAGADTKQFYDALAAVTAQKLNGVKVDWAALAAASKESLQQTYDKAQATYEAAQSSSLHFSSAAIQHFRDLRDAARNALFDTQAVAVSAFDKMNQAVMGISSSFDGWNKAIMTVDASIVKLAKDQASLTQGNTLDTATAAQDPQINALLKQGWSLKNAEAVKLAQQWGFTPQLFDPLGNPETSPSKGERVPGYAGGVWNAPGGWSMVGERGPEAMYVPKGASILPNGTAPQLGAQTINVVLDGRVLASVVNDITTRSMKQVRQFPGS